MKRNSRLIKTSGSILLIVFFVLVSTGHLHLPGYGNRENRLFEELVTNHVQRTLAKGEKVEFGNKFSCQDYKENGELRFSAHVTYYLVSENGTKEMHIAHVVCNGDKDKVIEWKEIKEQ